MLSKKQAKLFFLVGTFVTFAIFIGLTIYSLQQAQVQAEIPADVARGKNIWEKNNCMGCHTIMGEGAYYAPELTNVIERRGEGMVKSILMMDQPYAPRGRKMVAYHMSEEDANDVVAFFKWIGELDLNGFENVDRTVSPLAKDHMKN